MSEAIAAKRYADALFRLSEQKQATDQIEQQLRIVLEVFEGNKQLLPFLKHPKVSNDKKKQLIRETFHHFSKEVINTFLLLVDRHREELIPAIIGHYIDMENDAKGIAEAKVYTTRELSVEEKTQLSNVFAKKLNKSTLKIDNIVDPSIIGGVKLRIGNRIYDGTISGKLERIERNLVSAK
ncbi:F0F1 ATP synthase subunit delta [Sediminibacillus massiliensis]|uniref:F0F1 ATP synthase subunit delta n=1 Tax=Sediminibacillus massiliensis TaxID=1926277 RepID=UPI000988947F|nr:F0F1 ATP synthase subunit delta [Sediminibacillus massiliensis]